MSEYGENWLQKFLQLDTRLIVGLDWKSSNIFVHVQYTFLLDFRAASWNHSSQLPKATDEICQAVLLRCRQKVSERPDAFAGTPMSSDDRYILLL